MKPIKKISYAQTVYGEAEINAVLKCLNESTQMGQYSQKFEKKIAALFDKKYCLYVNSGSSALYIGIESLEFAKGSEIITPALTFSTTVGAIIKNSLVPVFVDVKPLTYCIDEDKIEEMITNKTVAILAPNLLGNLCNWVEISRIAKKHKLFVIEDSADTLGAYLHKKSSGAYTDMSITSFYGSHIINCAGNGGALTINSKTLMERAKLLRSWGRSSSLFDENSERIENRFDIKLGSYDYDAKFVFEKVGYNLEGSEIGAAFGLVQLDSLKENILIRKRNFKRLNEFFQNFPDLFDAPKETEGANTGWLAYPVLISRNANFTRKQFQIFLEKNSIQTRVVFTGNIIRQPMLRNTNYKTSPAGYPNADEVMENGVLLPVHHGMTEKMYEYLEESIKLFVSNPC